MQHDADLTQPTHGGSSPLGGFTPAPDDDRWRISPLDTVDDAFAASRLLAEIWGGDRDPMPAQLMRALAHSGNYVMGLYDDDELVGASVAFFAAPHERSMHSHVTGVVPSLQGKGLGRLLKQHQRAWALARDVGQITWTYDPLVARNAYFNLAVLGARATEYLVNQYGPMNDGINQGDESDRIMIAWSVAAKPAATPEPGAVVATVEIPDDIEGLRLRDRAAAVAWRERVREQFLAHHESGLVIGGFDPARGYLLVRP